MQSIFRRDVLHEDFHVQVERERSFFSELKKNGRDPSSQIEASFEDRLPEKVAKLLKEQGLSAIIRSCLPNEDRISLVLSLLQKLEGVYSQLSVSQRCDRIIRVILAVLTEGVLVAPLDGLSQISVDPTDNFLKIEVSGPIRGAGGSICALIYLIGEFLRKRYDLSPYVPTTAQVERGVSEMLAYVRKHPTQIRPSREELQFFLKNCPIMVDGTESEREEVPLHRYLPRIPKPRIRGGVALVVIEGFIVRGPKMLPYAKELGVNTKWLEQLIDIGKSYRKISGSRGGSKDSKYSLTIGRPLLSTTEGSHGLSLRVGTTPTVGLSGCNVSPLLIDLLRFINIGSQLIISSPGKASTVTGTCEDLRPPLVRYKDKVSDYVKGTRDSVLEVLDLGEVLFSAGEYIEFNKLLPPRDYCLGNFRHHVNYEVEIRDLSEEEILNLHLKYPLCKIPSPYSLSLDSLTFNEYLRLRQSDFQDLTPNEGTLKLLNKLNVRYAISEDRSRVLLSHPKIFHHYMARELPVSYQGYSDFLERQPPGTKGSSLISYVNSLSRSRMKLGERGTYTITARVGRAESVNMTRLKPKSCHSLSEYRPPKTVELFWKSIRKNPYGYGTYQMRLCPRGCGTSVFRRCPCGSETDRVSYCTQCDQYVPLKSLPLHTDHRQLVDKIRTVRDYVKEVDLVKEALREDLPSLNFKKQMKLRDSKNKVAYPESLMKGVLRSHFDLPVTKDGTFRICTPNLHTSHFTPAEAHSSVQSLRKLGYTSDVRGAPLEREDQVLALKLNDVIIPKESIDIFLRGCEFIDLLVKNYYNGPGFYFNARGFEDLLGVTIFSISPHTSSAPLGRIVGYTNNLGCYCHMIVVVNRRRDADGDLDGYGLASDLYLNGSPTYCEGKTGALMSVPLNLARKFYLDEVGKEILARELYSTYYDGVLSDNLKSYSVKQLKQLFRVENYLVKKQVSPQSYLYNTPGFKLNTDSTVNLYRDCASNQEKINLVLKLSDILPEIDQTECILGLIEGHLIPDYIGNMNAYFRQKLKCDHCKEDYQIEPLDIYCLKCKKGVLRFTVYKGMVLKYLNLIKKLRKMVVLPEALEERVSMLLENARNTFEGERTDLKNRLSDLEET